jgi:uncharacterized protein (TIGR03067 family)
MKLRCVPWIIALLLLAGPARADVEGSWRPVTAELDGNRLPGAELAELRLTLTATSYTLTNALGDDRGVVKKDGSQTPMTMDVTGTEGPNQGKTMLAIYQLSGDRLTICYDLTGKSRPTKFETRPGSRRFLVTYQRQKP